MKLEPHDREIILLKEEVRELKEQESAQEKAYGKLKEEVLLLRSRCDDATGDISNLGTIERNRKTLLRCRRACSSISVTLMCIG